MSAGINFFHFVFAFNLVYICYDLMKKQYLPGNDLCFNLIILIRLSDSDCLLQQPALDLTPTNTQSN